MSEYTFGDLTNVNEGMIDDTIFCVYMYFLDEKWDLSPDSKLWQFINRYKMEPNDGRRRSSFV